MLDASAIRKLFEALNHELELRKVVGEIGICGGAVMCLVFQARRATRDIDAIFEPAKEVREAALRVAKRFGVPKDWLNDAAKGFFFSDPPRQDVLEFSSLRIWAPTAQYMLAMKCLAARWDSKDKDDVQFLLKYLGLKEAKKVFSIIEKYCPRSRIPAKTKFFIEELLG